VSIGKKVSVLAVSVIALAAVVLVVVFGVVGISQTVSAGTQPTVCGTTLGVTSSDDSVRFPGVSDGQHTAGERVRLSPLCVVEIVRVDNGAAASANDGSSARVQLTWRLW
jgi:hypothetical protein